MPTVEIISQGDEVVTGQVTDTNAAWLATELSRMGCAVRRHTTVGDELDDIAAVLRETVERADICVCTGGLGPTTDDLTAAAVSTAFSRPLWLDQEALAGIRQCMERRGRPMAACNEKQAWLPQGSERMDNLWGTAPGFTVFQGTCWLVFLPGVPSEMRAMFTHWVKPRLLTQFTLSPPRRVVFHTTGPGESTLQERINRLNLPHHIRLGFLAQETGVQVKLAFTGHEDETDQQHWVAAVTRILGDDVTRVDIEPA